MERDKTLWQRMMAPFQGSDQAQAETSYKSHPNYMKAQKRATEDYFKTGQQKPLKDYLDDPDLK